MSKSIRVLVVDDEQGVRDTLVRSFSYQPDIEVVGEARDGQQAVALVTEIEVDVIVMDIKMPNMTGPEAVRKLRRKGIQTPVVFFSSDAEASAKAVRLSNSRFVLKDRGGAREVMAAVRQANAS